MPLWWSFYRFNFLFVFVLFETNTENEVCVREHHFHWSLVGTRPRGRTRTGVGVSCSPAMSNGTCEAVCACRITRARHSSANSEVVSGTGGRSRPHIVARSSRSGTCARRRARWRGAPFLPAARVPSSARACAHGAWRAGKEGDPPPPPPHFPACGRTCVLSTQPQEVRLEPPRPPRSRPASSEKYFEYFEYFEKAHCVSSAGSPASRLGGRSAVNCNSHMDGNYCLLFAKYATEPEPQL